MNLLNRLVIASTLIVMPVVASAIGETAGNLVSNQQVSSIAVDQQVLNSNVSWQNQNFTQAKKNSASASYFGEQVFSGGFSGIRADGLNAAYKIMPGDQVIVRVWGNVEVERVLPVDSQGNIFIPAIGPVQVQGLTPAQLTPTVKAAISRIYTSGVDVYTQLQGVQPISIYVTGFVNNPGHYAGTPSDSIIHFLNQANGINNELGSYRHIKIMRNAKLLAEFDIYDFVTNGLLPDVQLKEGDTIVVEQRGPMVSVMLQDQSMVNYELENEAQTGESLLQYALLPAGISHALITGYDVKGPSSDYLEIARFKKQMLKNGDQILLTQDQRNENILVQIEGSYLGRSSFILPKNARLADLLANIKVDQNLTATRNVSIRRKSIAEQQKSSLQSSLDRLEQTYMTASSSTPEEAAIRVKEAELIMGFVQRAKVVKPNGRLVVADGENVANVRLQDGDIITLPSLSDSVLVSGQVLVPTSLVYQENWLLQDYIDKTGGFTEQADEDRIVVIRQSGEVISDASVMIRPGDEIMVLPKVPTKNIQLATSITQILYQIAIAAKVILDL